MTGSDLDRIARIGTAEAWVAERSRAWLEFWRGEAGLDGFYPFDLMAAAYVRNPAPFVCARVTAWVGEDALLPWLDGGPALLVAQQEACPRQRRRLPRRCSAMSSPSVLASCSRRSMQTAKETFNGSDRRA